MAFLHTPTIRNYLTVPAHILNDDRVSVEAKGLYMQLLYSNNQIHSLEEITKFTTTTKDKIIELFKELTSIGYIVVKDNRADIVMKPQGEKTVAKKLDIKAVETFTETVKEKKKSKYEIMCNLINSYDLPVNVKKHLISYFENWLHRKGRYADASELHSNKVRALIGDLISFHLNEADMISCIQTSIDREYYRFFLTKDQSLDSATIKQPKSTFVSFDKTAISSGSYTIDDIKAIKERSALLEAQGKKGKF